MSKKGNIQAAFAVLWGFFGVRKRRDYDADAKNLTQAQIIIAGLIGGVVFVLTLLLAVYLVLQSVK
ncbi:MAG: hypothetical protein BGP20_05155 [Thiobacillus sp. 63-78]|uniref:DUF2970 domain-containing protein n=1 Tax=Thiobacillus sp. 63-78 TaxID=1895859 RepID=UPI00086CC27D|nr:DUF2970 domain-containing protein [Thiobacillus sp. 63-78]MBN8763593.1 DUF2970 domain-containing protein [Thiobacillus sp.]ODV12783.1 MAG: hypothetical protein ABT22_05790 [Thiobacillus sp. SCN 64-317]MBN8765029.1 DUF2970 domain-containing protein [Thiobacillus sp.]MBN8773887.1 DUF2970 domain-containing protein [Thiobacillus sp.]OJZ14842.1 MAG: hypothetical protein BGP20_05155 [Thiobacillus sp. 63-78]